MKRYFTMTYTILIILSIFSFTQISYADIVTSTVLNPPIDDALINSKVQSEIDLSEELAGESIRVSTNHGVVTLEGEVTDLAQIDVARRIARDVTGVLEVNSDLTIKSSNP